jgi:hypothetical protein
LLVWGGQTFPVYMPDEPPGVAYDPERDEWRTLPTPSIDNRYAHVASFTGSELLVWGGLAGDGVALADGAAYAPETDTWRILPASPLMGGAGYVAAWTGTEWLTVEAGSEADTDANSGRGAAYDPATNRWRVLPDAPLPGGWAAAAAWTGTVMVIVRVGSGGPSGGAQYDPSTDAWTPIPANPALTEGQTYPFATWAGGEVLLTREVIQTSRGAQDRNEAWGYDPSTLTWREKAPPPISLAYSAPAVVGDRVVFYAPHGRQGWVYRPSLDSWLPMPRIEDRGREFWSATAISDSSVVVWGGSNPAGDATSEGLVLEFVDP